METQTPLSPACESFGILPDETEARCYTLRNSHGTKAVICNFGATLISLEIADREGKLADVVLGYDSAEPYALDTNPSHGATVGRFGNRIAHGKFELDGIPYQLATNNDPGGIPCHLHGGNIGFNRRMWTVIEHDSTSITFEYLSPAGEENYPGTLTTRVTYLLTEDNELQWNVSATTDAATPINIVNHTYWNLSGDPSSLIHDHLLTLAADEYLPATVGLIPTGERHPVSGTPMDFTRHTRVGDRIKDDFEALKNANGYDACWIIRDARPDGMAFAGRVEDPATGRIMEVFTNQPGVHFYSGNFLDDTVPGKGGACYQPGSGLCLETENFPDAPNHPDFPDCILRPGKTYEHRLTFRFSVK
ncbi:aldose epimerase family protein [Haloferula rosea]|uniref:Aldose 1-epimerase n=1 Tax=Haloferula rosea TaxID=490093 RepID=A0A934RHF4_9BACT|nr:aldose epimerase family protein [Haloferula rosea]MBK1828390.1 galactose mutarotase [Haloferula rosea]